MFRVLGSIVAALLFALPAPAPAVPSKPVLAQTSALTPAERRLILDAMARAGMDWSQLGDAALVEQILAFARRELGLRVRPAAVDRLWSISPPERDPRAELLAARTRGTLEDWLAELATRHSQHQALRSAAARYRAASLAPFNPLPSLPVLREGDEHPALDAVRQRLASEGFVSPAPAAPGRFDPGFKTALAAFQARRGLEVDGVLGPMTLAALNITPGQRAAQIDANLERLRWLPGTLPPDRIEVNIAAAEARLIRNDRPVLRMRVVVGDLSHKTPMFTSNVEAVVFNPPWNVPASIARAEILPKVARDPGYLARNGFVRIGDRLQQKPGPGNALGRIKFDLPSPFGVYLHDTPGKAAFQRPMRALSHGCMRLEKPNELAAAVLSSQGWSPADVEAAIATGATRRVALQRPVPLYVVYQTAWVEGDEIHFVPDVYGWDAKLNAALAGAERQSVRTAAADTDCAEAGSAAG